MSSGSALAVMDCFWKETISIQRQFREKENNSNKISVRLGEQKATLYSRACASGDEGKLLAFRRPLTHGRVRLMCRLETEAWELNPGATATQEETLTAITCTGAEGGQNSDCRT